eukprot:c25169_g4_i1 orf=942-3269(-)
MQRAAASQLTRLLICPLRRHQALLLNSTFPYPAAASADEILPSGHHLLHLHHLHRSLHELSAIASRPAPLTELAVASRPAAPSTILRNCMRLSVLVRCFSNGSLLPCPLVQYSDGLPSTQQSITEEPSPDCTVVSGHATWNQEKQQGDISSIAEGKAVSPVVLLSDTKSQVDTEHVVLHRLLRDPHYTQSSEDSKGNTLATSPSDVALRLHGNKGFGVRNHVVLEGPLLPSGSDWNEASSPSDIVPQALTDGGVKGIDDSVLESRSFLENDIGTDSSEACAKQSFEQKFGHSSELPVDASSVSLILDKYGWGPHTEGILQSFIGSITPELVANVVHEQKDAKVAFHFIEWAGKQPNFEHQEEIFTKVVGRLGKCSDFETAWTVLEFMRKHGLKVNYAFGIFIHRLKSANMVDEAIRAMDSMVSLDVNPTVPLYTVAFQLLLNCNNLKDVQRLYMKMRQVGLQPDTKLFGILVSGFGKAGKVDDALFFFEEMQRSGVLPDSFIYTSLIGTLATVGQYGEGQKFYTEMVQNNCLPSVLSRLDLECALYGVSSMEQIQRFLEGLENRGHLISVHTYNNLLQHLLDNKMLTEAVEVFCRLLEEPQRQDRLQSLDKAAAGPNVDSYSLLICGLCKEGELTEALLLFKEMLVKGFKSSSEVCNCLLHGLSSNKGYVYEAVELSSHVVRAKLIVDVETQKTFLRALHTSGDMSKALQIFNTMKWRGCIDPRSNFHELIGVVREEPLMQGSSGGDISEVQTGSSICPCELTGVSLSTPGSQNK